MKVFWFIFVNIMLISVLYNDTSFKDTPNKYTNLICNLSLIEYKYKCYNVGTCLAKRILLQYNNISLEYHNDANFVELPPTFECAIHKDHPNILVVRHHYEYLSVLQQKSGIFLMANMIFILIMEHKYMFTSL